MKLVLFSLFFTLSPLVHAQTSVVPFTVKNHAGAQILADSKGRTLYVFDRDSGSISNCYNGCATEWPPSLLTDNSVQSVSAPLGTTLRKDQTVQITYDGRPVYLYLDDQTADDAQGDGLGGIWHVIQVK